MSTTDGSDGHKPKALFITGAASGIGKATAEHFAERGWFVGLADVDEEGLGRLAGTLGAERCVSVSLDVADRAQWDVALETFSAASGGRMDLFFNNAGIARSGAFEEMPEEDAAAIMAVNIGGVVHGLYATFPLLKATAERFGRAQIVNTGSASGVIGAPRLAVYAASKFAVRGLTDSLHVEFARHNIHVSELQPWFLDTNILATVPTGSNDTAREALTANKVPVLPATLAAEAVWKLSEQDNPTVHVGVGWPARWLQWQARLFPSFTRWQIRSRFSDNPRGTGF